MDQVNQGNLTIEYCPTDALTGNFMTKTLQGKKFEKFRKETMGFLCPTYCMLNVYDVRDQAY